MKSSAAEKSDRGRSRDIIFWSDTVFLEGRAGWQVEGCTEGVQCLHRGVGVAAQCNQRPSLQTQAPHLCCPLLHLAKTGAAAPWCRQIRAAAVVARGVVALGADVGGKAGRCAMVTVAALQSR